MQGTIRKTRWLWLALVVLGAGCLFLTANDHELEPEQVAVRSEGISGDALRWCFDADSTEGEPLETVFYTVEYTPQREENAVWVVVRLYDAPAEGRRKLSRTGERNTCSAQFDLVHRFHEPDLAPKSGLSYRISFCGKNLGTWRNSGKNALALCSHAAGNR